jgi:hypothetical protein
MKFYQSLLGISVFALGLIATCPAFAQDAKLDAVDPDIANAERPSPITEGDDADDPYKPHFTFQKGPQKGKEVDVSFRRSIQVLNEDSKTETVTVANFMHNDQFHIATIPLNGVEQMIFHIDWFNSSVPAAHTEIRIRFKADMPIIIRPQLKSAQGEAPVAIREMVLSIEAVKGKSSAMALIAGFARNYAIAYRFLSLKDKRRDLVDTVHEKVSQYVLNLNADQQKTILKNAIEVSDKSGVHVFYNTWERNCTTELIQLFDHSLHYNIWRNILKQSTVIGSHYPIWIRASLKTRGLLGEQLPDLDQDPSEDILDYPVSP